MGPRQDSAIEIVAVECGVVTGVFCIVLEIGA